jgi:transposase
MRMKNHPQFFISKRPRRSPWVGITIGIDLGDIWSHYCTLNENGEVIDRGRFRTNAAGVNKRFGGIDSALVAMENGTHSIWVSEQIKELGHEVIVGNVRELRAISHSDRKSDKVDAEKIPRYARVGPEILRPIAHRTVAQQETLTLIRARDVLAEQLWEFRDINFLPSRRFPLTAVPHPVHKSDPPPDPASPGSNRPAQC